MWMRLDAITRSPASSSIRVTEPVRLRRVASGLIDREGARHGHGKSSGDRVCWKVARPLAVMGEGIKSVPRPHQGPCRQRPPSCFQKCVSTPSRFPKCAPARAGTVDRLAIEEVEAAVRSPAPRLGTGRPPRATRVAPLAAAQAGASRIGCTSGRGASAWSFARKRVGPASHSPADMRSSCARSPDTTSNRPPSSRTRAAIWGSTRSTGSRLSW